MEIQINSAESQSKAQLALTRGEWMKTKIREHFYDGIRECLGAEESRSNVELEAAGIQLDVFAVGSLDYQKLAGLLPDEAAQTFTTQGQTGVTAQHTDGDQIST